MLQVDGAELQVCYGCRQKLNPAEAGKAGGRVQVGHSRKAWTCLGPNFRGHMHAALLELAVMCTSVCLILQRMEDTRNIKGAPLKEQPAGGKGDLKQSKLRLGNLQSPAFYGRGNEPVRGQLNFIPSNSVGRLQRPAAATVAAPAARQHAGDGAQQQQQRGGNGAAGRQQQQQRRQPQRQKAGSDSDYKPGNEKGASGSVIPRLLGTSARSTRRRAQQQQQHDGMGTEVRPELLLWAALAWGGPPAGCVSICTVWRMICLAGMRAFWKQLLRSLQGRSTTMCVQAYLQLAGEQANQVFLLALSAC